MDYLPVHWPYLLAVALVAVATITIRGYHFAWGDQTLYIPYMTTYFGPSSFHPNDLVMEKTWSFYTYLWMSLNWLKIHVGLQWMLFILFIGSRILQFIAYYILGERLGRHPAAGLLTTVLLLFNWPIGGTTTYLYDIAVTTRSVIIPLAMLALLPLLKQRFVASAALIGWLFNFHAMTAIFVGMIWMVTLLLSLRAIHWRRAVQATLVGFIAALPLCIWILRMHESAPLVAPDDWLTILRARNPYNFYNTWDAWKKGTLWFPLLLIPGSLMILNLPGAVTRFAWGVFGGCLLGGIIGVLFGSVWPLTPILHMQILRIFLFGLVIESAFAAAAVVRLTISPRHTFDAFLALILLYAALMRHPASLVGGGLVLLPLAIWRDRLEKGAQAFLHFPHRVIPISVTTLAGLAAFFLLLHNLTIDQPWPDIWPFRSYGTHLLRLPLEKGRAAYYALAFVSMLFLVHRLPIRNIAARFGTVLLLLFLIYRSVDSMGWLDISEKDRFSPSAYAHGWARRVHLPWEDLAEKSPFAAVCYWIRDNTLPGALWMVPPTAASFRFLAMRSPVVTKKDGSLANFDIDYGLAWWQRARDFRLSECVGGNDTKNYMRLSTHRIKRLARQYDIDYVLWPKKTNKEVYERPRKGKSNDLLKLKLPLLHETSHYFIYRLPEKPRPR